MGIYKGCMLSDVPNFAFVMGCFDTSWTLKADITCDFICRVLHHMDSCNYATCYPQHNGVAVANRQAYLNNEELKVSSGYIQRGLESLPWTGTEAPWATLTSYMSGKKKLQLCAIEDGVLQFHGHMLSRDNLWTHKATVCSPGVDLDSPVSYSFFEDNCEG